MPNKFVVGPFTANTNEFAGTIVISRDGENLSLFTGEGAVAKKAINFAADMFSVEVMPEYVAYSPFRLHFLPDGRTRLEKPEGGVFFGREDYEELVNLIDMCVVSIADRLRLQGGARAGKAMPGPGDPII